MSVSAFRRVLDAIIRLFSQDVDRARAAVSAVSVKGMDEAQRAAALAAARATFTTLMADATRRGRRRAWAAAVLHLEQQAGEQAGLSSFLPAEPPYDSGLVAEALRSAGGPVTAPRTQQIVAASLTRHVEMAARQTIVAAVDEDLDDGTPQDEELTHTERLALEELARAQQAEDAQDQQEHDQILQEARDTLTAAGISLEGHRTDIKGRRIARPFAWARVLQQTADKPACGFCVVCAARGPVYSSREAALTRDGSVTRRYHDHCRCVAVPVYSSANWPGKEDYERLADAYEQVVSETGLSGAPARTAMDNWSRGNRSAAKSQQREARKAGVPDKLPVRSDTPTDTQGKPVLLPPAQIGEVPADAPGMEHVVSAHAHGAGNPGKTEFPTADPEVIARIVHNVIHDPQAVWERYSGMYAVTSSVAGYPVQVNITMINPGRAVWTAYPVKSAKFPPNPKKGKRSG